MFHFSSEIIFGQLLKTFGNFFLVTLIIIENTLGIARRAARSSMIYTLSPLVERNEGTLCPKQAKKYASHSGQHFIMFNYWADPVGHLLLIKNSTIFPFMQVHS